MKDYSGNHSNRVMQRRWTKHWKNKHRARDAGAGGGEGERLNVLLRRLVDWGTRSALVFLQGGGNGRHGAGAEGVEAAAAEALAYRRAVPVLVRRRGARGVEGGDRQGRDRAEQQTRVFGDLDDEAVRGEGLKVVPEMHEKRDVRAHFVHQNLPDHALSSLQ